MTAMKTVLGFLIGVALYTPRGPGDRAGMDGID